jgi:hypothetical protein
MICLNVKNTRLSQYLMRTLINGLSAYELMASVSSVSVWITCCICNRDYLEQGVLMKRKQVTCNCPAYKFPHRMDSKACKELYDSGSDETYKDTSLRDFDSTEAKAINSERNIFMQVRF